MSTRRTFLKQAALGLGALSGVRLLASCSRDPLAHITGGITGANHKTGHLLRNAGQLPAPTEQMETDILIVGGGISGFSARRWLSRNSDTSVLLLEMDEKPGGNARYGRNEISAYPYGAHYLPVPDLRNTELLDLLQGCGSITGYDAKGLPVYNEYHLCQDPEERLFINGYWQEGLVPEAGISAEYRAQVKRFFSEIEKLKGLKGADGKDAFAIPLQNASSDAAFARLHDISFAAYLDEQGFTAKPLRWYLEYCCKDDYGAVPADVSAWAGLHYFASRKGLGSNATHASMLTWPEGNGFLMEALKQEGRGTIISGVLVYAVERNGDGILAKAYHPGRKTSIAIRARKAILATPVSVNKRLLQSEELYSRVKPEEFQRAPWVIANLTVRGLPQGRGMPLCWDNVPYGTPSVGYVNAAQQALSDSAQKVITYYLPITGSDTNRARQEVSKQDFRYWMSRVVAELEVAHSGIAACISHADIWIWGHGMIRPSPGFFNNGQRSLAARPIDDKVFFAHTDLSGISIFEEAFYQGIGAAKQLLNML